MIAKVIVHAPTRREAAARLARVLETTTIQGLTTNLDFLVNTLRNSAFIAGDTTTDFIERVQPGLTREIDDADMITAGIAALIEGQARRRARATVNRRVISGWRNSTMPPQRLTLTASNREFAFAYRTRRDGSFDIHTGDSAFHVEVNAAGNGTVDLTINGIRQQFDVTAHADQWLIQSHLGGISFTEMPRYPSSLGSDAAGGLMAPMPGAVLATEVEAGQTVHKGQLLLILEAMKMEHRIIATADGTVAALHVNVGDQVENGQLLVTISEA